MSDRCPDCGGFRTMPRILDRTSDNPRECENAFHKSDAPVEVIEETPNVTAQETTETNPQVAPGIGIPLCPYCGAEGRLNGRTTNLGPFKVVTVFCRDCRKVLFGFQALEMQLMQIPPGGVPN